MKGRKTWKGFYSLLTELKWSFTLYVLTWKKERKKKFCFSLLHRWVGIMRNTLTVLRSALGVERMMLLMWVLHQSNQEKLHEKYGITYGIRETETPTLSGTHSITQAIQKKAKNKNNKNRNGKMPRCVRNAKAKGVTSQLCVRQGTTQNAGLGRQKYKWKQLYCSTLAKNTKLTYARS